MANVLGEMFVKVISDPIFQLFLTLVLTAVGISGVPSLTTARFLLVAAWCVGIYGLVSRGPFVGVRLIGLIGALTVLMALLVAWAQPVVIPGNVGRLVAHRTIWSGLWPQRIMEIDGTGARLKWVGPDGKAMFDLITDSGLTIERYGKTLLFSTRLRDRTGNLVAEIVRNDWKVSSNAWDRNYNSDSLEVRNAAGEVVLQVRVLADRIQVQGEWRDAQGRTMRLARGENGFAVMELMGPNSTPIPNTIKPMFRYPSELYLGKLVDDADAR